MRGPQPKVILGALAILGLGAVAFALWRGDRIAGTKPADARIAGVQVASIERRPLELERTFSGALEAASELVVAPKVAGRIQRFAVDLADRVARGQTVVFLDDAEFVQALRQAQAELAVAQANLAQARNALEISRREHQRVMTLRERGIASDSESDLAEASRLEKEAAVDVAEAHVSRATAALEAARIRCDYTRVTADWSEGDTDRIVAERYLDEGATVSANEALLRIVKLDPIVAVLSVTDRDYGRLRPGLEARLTTDAFPGETFRGRITRIAPVFRETSRQARVELNLANPDARLKPGMFIRATIVLDRVDAGVAVPEAALTQRGDVKGVFLVRPDGQHVSWTPVETGIRSQGWVQLLQPSPTGQVVTLGQHLIDDGAAIRVVATYDAGPTP
jgi:RND family efflux transporter MFP subunit